MGYVRPYFVSLVVQGELLTRTILGSQFVAKRGELRWWGWVTPSTTSANYKVRLTYRLGFRPAVHVLEPKLIIPLGETLPHTYQGNELCLYYPKNKEWHEGKILARTVLPWSSEWLYHYEIWVVTGQWNGGGIHY